MKDFAKRLWKDEQRQVRKLKEDRRLALIHILRSEFGAVGLGMATIQGILERQGWPYSLEETDRLLRELVIEGLLFMDNEHRYRLRPVQDGQQVDE